MKWLKQTSTIGGFLSLVITGIHAYQSGGDAMTAVLAVLSGALLLTRDGQFLAGFAVLLFVGQMSTGCAALPKMDAETAVQVGCTVADLGGCFDDTAVQVAFPGINMGNCIDRVQYLKDLSTGAISIDDADSAFIVLSQIDLSKVNMPSILELKRASCRKLKNAMGL